MLQFRNLYDYKVLRTFNKSRNMYSNLRTGVLTVSNKLNVFNVKKLYYFH